MHTNLSVVFLSRQLQQWGWVSLNKVTLTDWKGEAFRHLLRLVHHRTPLVHPVPSVLSKPIRESHCASAEGHRGPAEVAHRDPPSLGIMTLMEALLAKDPCHPEDSLSAPDSQALVAS